MKLLMVLDGVDFPFAPNPRLACRLAAELAGLGHTIHILYMAGTQADLPALPPSQNLSLIPLFFSAEANMEAILEHGAPGGTPVVRRLLRLTGHPLCAVAAFRRVVLHRPARIGRCRRELERLCRLHRYDAVLTVNAPYHSAEALMQARLSAKRLVWQMDPLLDNPSSQGPRAASLERTLYQRADGLFITREMAGRSRPATGRPKTMVLEFPCFIPPTDDPGLYPAPSQDPDGPVRVVFVGSLYQELRTPHFALALFEALALPRAVLVFVGGGWENYPPALVQGAKAALGSRLVITGPLPPAQAQEELQQADVLLNLGNAGSAQLPSKIFEYFSTGKPILTLAKTPDDPALPYLAQYPLSLILQESGGLGSDILQQARDFLDKYAHARCDMAQVSQLFEANTPRAVALSFLKGLERLEILSPPPGGTSPEEAVS